MGKYILLSEDHFESIISKLDSIEKKLDDPKSSLNGWLTAKQAKELLGIKETTLWKYRNMGMLTHTKIQRTVYYSQEGILNLLEKNKISAYRNNVP